MSETRGQARVVSIAPEYFQALEQLQVDCYPTMDAQARMRVEHFASQHAVFPEGQFVALIDGRVVGQGSGLFVDIDFQHTQHTFLEIVDHLYFRNHDPAGDYYYGADISVHPDFRGRGIGRQVYEARQKLVIDRGKKGIVAGGMLPGYRAYRDRYSAAEYVDRVVAGELHDPTLTFQLHNGFEVRGLLEDYLEDEASCNWATLIVWENPELNT